MERKSQQSPRAQMTEAVNRQVWHQQNPGKKINFICFHLCCKCLQEGMQHGDHAVLQPNTHSAGTLPALSWETDLPEKADPCSTCAGT